MYKTLVRFLFVALMVVGMAFSVSANEDIEEPQPLIPVQIDPTAPTDPTTNACVGPVCFKSTLYNYSSYNIIICDEGPGLTCLNPTVVPPGGVSSQLFQLPDVDLFTFAVGQGLSTFTVYNTIIPVYTVSAGTLIDVPDLQNIYCYGSGGSAWCNVW